MERRSTGRVKMLTNPPIAFPPYSAENAPRTTSTRSTSSTGIVDQSTAPVYELFMG